MERYFDALTAEAKNRGIDKFVECIVDHLRGNTRVRASFKRKRKFDRKAFAKSAIDEIASKQQLLHLNLNNVRVTNIYNYTDLDTLTIRGFCRGNAFCVFFKSKRIIPDVFEFRIDYDECGDE